MDKSEPNWLTTVGDAEVTITGGTFDSVAAGYLLIAITGKVTYRISGCEISNCIDGGNLARGNEGTFDYINQTLDTAAVVNHAVMNIIGCKIGTVVGGGEGSTRVKNSAITVEDSTISESLFIRSVNSYTDWSTLTVKGNTTIGQLYATNRGYLGTGVANIESGTEYAENFPGRKTGVLYFTRREAVQPAKLYEPGQRRTLGVDSSSSANAA